MSITVFILAAVIKIVLVVFILLTAVAYTTLLERKVVGRMQNRWGPTAWDRSACCNRWPTA